MSRFRIVNTDRRRPTTDQPKTANAGSMTYSSGELHKVSESKPFDGYAEEVYRGPIADYVMRIEDGVEAAIYRIHGRSETGAERGETTTGGGDTINAGRGTPMAHTTSETKAQDRALARLRSGTADAFGDPRVTLRQIEHARDARRQWAGLAEINRRNRRSYGPPDAA
jgi:hypothetical protein